MTLGIMQPYFMPYIGYFQLMKAVDKYVVYDDVNYIKGGWINRNNLLIGGEKKLFTVMLKGASPNKRINEIEVGDDFRAFRKTLQLNYSKAPCFGPAMDVLERIFACRERILSRFVFHSFREVNDYLQIPTELVLSSDLQKDCSLKGKDKVIHICKLLEADSYLNAIGGQELYDKTEFASHGLSLGFLEAELTPYPQFGREFTPGLSMIDVLMFNTPGQIGEMLDRYRII